MVTELFILSPVHCVSRALPLSFNDEEIIKFVQKSKLNFCLGVFIHYTYTLGCIYVVNKNIDCTAYKVDKFCSSR